MEKYFQTHQWVVSDERLKKFHDKCDALSARTMKSGNSRSVIANKFASKKLPCPVCSAGVDHGEGTLSFHDLYGRNAEDCQFPDFYACPCCGVKLTMDVIDDGPEWRWLARIPADLIPDSVIDMIRSTIPSY